MAYNSVDILNKAITILEKKKQIYINIKDENNDNLSMKIIIDILIKDIEKTTEYYNKLKLEAANASEDEIDFVAYDKISFLINQFNERIYAPEISDVKDFMLFSLGYEKQAYGLLVDMQGRLVKTDMDSKTHPYKVLTKMINRKVKLIESIEKNIR